VNLYDYFLCLTEDSFGALEESTISWLQFSFESYCMLRILHYFGLCCSCLPWHEVFYDLMDHVANCLNDAKNQSVFPLLSLLYDVEQFKSGEPVSVADVSINEVSDIWVFVLPFLQCFEAVGWRQEWHLTLQEILLYQSQMFSFRGLLETQPNFE